MHDRLYSVVTLFGQCLVFVLLVGLGEREAWAWPPRLLHPDGAVQDDVRFPEPEPLLPAIAFWQRLFLRYDSHQMVLHDREHMDLVWEVIDLPIVERTGKVDERRSDKRVKEAAAALRARLRRLADDPTPKDQSDVLILAAVGAKDRSRLRGAHQRLRAQRGVADHFQEGLVRSREFLTQILTILAEERVPQELAALPFVESMFNPRARSSAGAAGLWQLMPATARWLGLQVRRQGDERYDTLKATRAAARMLRKSYGMLGSWPLALTAYNHGPYGVRRAVKAVGSTDLTYLIDHYRRSTWGFASKNFYAEFLAVLRIVANNPAFSGKTVLSQSDLPAPATRGGLHNGPCRQPLEAALHGRGTRPLSFLRHGGRCMVAGQQENKANPPWPIAEQVWCVEQPWRLLASRSSAAWGRRWGSST